MLWRGSKGDSRDRGNDLCQIQREHRAKTARFAEERGRVEKGMWKLAVGVGLGRECLGLELVRIMKRCLQVASFFFSEVGGWVIPAGERGESRREVLKRPGKFALVVMGTRGNS